MKEVKPLKLTLSKQTVATLEANQLNAVRAGNVQPEITAPTSTFALSLVTLIFSSC